MHCHMIPIFQCVFWPHMLPTVQCPDTLKGNREESRNQACWVLSNSKCVPSLNPNEECRCQWKPKGVWPPCGSKYCSLIWITLLENEHGSFLGVAPKRGEFCVEELWVVFFFPTRKCQDLLRLGDGTSSVRPESHAKLKISDDLSGQILDKFLITLLRKLRAWVKTLRIWWPWWRHSSKCFRRGLCCLKTFFLQNQNTGRCVVIGFLKSRSWDCVIAQDLVAGFIQAERWNKIFLRKRSLGQGVVVTGRTNRIQSHEYILLVLSRCHSQSKQRELPRGP